MSDLRPTGVPIMLDGVERHFLFTLNAIDEIQSHYGMTLIEALGRLYDDKESISAIRYFVKVLLDDETEREKWKNPDSDIRSYSEKEIGWLISVDNIGEITNAILEAYRISIPEPGDDPPNQESGQQSS